MANEKTNFRKARELGAPDVTELITTVPYLKRLLSKGQVAQLQRVIDAEFLNPVYVKEFRKAIEASVIGRGGKPRRLRSEEEAARLSYFGPADKGFRTGRICPA